LDWPGFPSPKKVGEVKDKRTWDPEKRGTERANTSAVGETGPRRFAKGIICWNVRNNKVTRRTPRNRPHSSSRGQKKKRGGPRG